MNHLKDITVLVLGLGESGLAMARWCARGGASVRVWDSRETPPNAAALAQHVPAATLLGGALSDAAFDGVQLVLKSPGLAPSDARIAETLSRAADRGVLVQGELELFARALADLKAERGYAPKLVAITGTNGKTTTTAMAALLIGRTGKRVAMAGNIGPTMLQTLADALDREPETPIEPISIVDTPVIEEEVVAVEAPETVDVDDTPTLLVPPPPPPPSFEHLPDVWVLELSSFQLDE
ncbi:MAG TPA: Mur ligase family protein, partial [Albitalea sp.]|nr:Mur ligase family protein [Albitalea sp.]